MAVKFEKRIATNRLSEFAAMRDKEAHFTIHENGNTGSSPYDEAGFVRNGGGAQKVMYHFSVGVENDEPIIVQIFPVSKRGKHAGNSAGNATSAAVEVCQSPPGATSAKTQAALQELLCMLYTGDKRIEGIEGYDFSPDRTRGHKDWPGANPNCPQNIIAKWGGVEPIVKTARARLAAGDNGGSQPPAVTFPKAVPIPVLAAVSNADINAPAYVTIPGDKPITAWFTGDRYKVIRETPRRMFAYITSEIIGPSLKVGETFDIDFVFENAQGKWGYTPEGTRVFLDDLERVADKKGAV